MGKSCTNTAVWWCPASRRAARIITPQQENALGLQVKNELEQKQQVHYASDPQVVDYVPHAPATFIKGRVISIYGYRGRLAEVGQNSVVALNRGAADGLEVGHVLALYTQSRPVKVANGGTLQTPEERFGLVFVFRVFERVSYALVMKISRPVSNLDIVQTP